MAEARHFDNITTYVHIDDGPGAKPLAVGDDFWQTLGERTDLGPGRLMCTVHFDESWSTWEVHPVGDEVVYLLNGSVDFVLDLPAEQGGEQRVGLRGRGACIVPRGVWHRAIVHEPSDVLFITRGEGTEHRPI